MKTTQWNTLLVLQLLTEAIPEIVKAERLTDGEFYTTNSVHIEVKNALPDHFLWVRGFTTEVDGLPGEDRDENLVEMVEVTTGYSDGDMPDDPALILTHAKIRVELIKAGFKVVDSLERFF